MRILIIEDEHYASKRLKSLIEQELPDANILEIIDTVEESVLWLSSHVEPNLIFMDIQLADGLSFQIFDKVKVNCPIIFTTAYDEYALNAFKVNSIDYLLKPLEQEALRKSINKYQQMYPATSKNDHNWKSITKDIFQPSGNFKQRFLVKTGNSYSYLKSDEIAILYSEDGLSFALSNKGKKILLDHTLDKIEALLDPNKFFRISRKHIVSVDSIQKINPYFNNRLTLELNQNCTEQLIVSRQKVKDFKMWLDQ